VTSCTYGGLYVNLSKTHPMLPYKTLFLIFSLSLSVQGVSTASPKPQSDKAVASVPPRPGKVGELPASSRASLKDKKARPYIFADPDYFQWGGSCILGEDGKYHLFYSRWKRDNPRGMYGWLYESEIAHAVSQHPEGPYTYKDTVLKGFGSPQPNRWDACNAHNPNITYMKDPKTGKNKYYLYYIATRDDNNMKTDWWDHIINQRIGVAVSDSLNGPWTRHPQPVITPPTGPLHYYLVNPGVCQLPNGKYLMVLKGRREGKGKQPVGPVLHGWALSDSPTGPFKAKDTLLFPASYSAEDPCVWVQDGWIMAAVKDWHGQISGTRGISFVRGKMDFKGDIAWQIPENASIAGREIRWSDGKKTHLNATERPFILLDASGKPSHLFMAASVTSPFKNGSQIPKENRKIVPLDNLPFNACLPLEQESKEDSPK